MTEPCGSSSPGYKVSSSSPCPGVFMVKETKRRPRALRVPRALPPGQRLSAPPISPAARLVLTALTSAASPRSRRSSACPGSAAPRSGHPSAPGPGRGGVSRGSRGRRALLDAEPGRGHRRLAAAAGSGCRATERKRGPRRAPRRSGRPREGCESEVAPRSCPLAPSSEPWAPGAAQRPPRAPRSRRPAAAARLRAPQTKHRRRSSRPGRRAVGLPVPPAGAARWCVPPATAILSS